MLRISQPRIISFVRLLGKPGIFRPLLEYCAVRVDQPQLEAVPSSEASPWFLRRHRRQECRDQIATDIPGQDSPVRCQDPDAVGENFRLPCAAL